MSIDQDRFIINGRPTYEGRHFRDMRVEGLLMNSRMANGIFDDLNPTTRHFWNYPDTGNWDPQRNTREFVAAMANWRQHGLLSFTINLQGGNPRGYTEGTTLAKQRILRRRKAANGLFPATGRSAGYGG